MSLNAEQRQITSHELNENFALSGLSTEQLAEKAGTAPEQVADALQVENADPAVVWHLRDALEQAVREAGRTPVPFTVLTEGARRNAQGWFGI